SVLVTLHWSSLFSLLTIELVLLGWKTLQCSWCGDLLGHTDLCGIEHRGIERRGIERRGIERRGIERR
ncbi:unnamed protein product, partial [Closterium sp. NIES-53]